MNVQIYCPVPSNSARELVKRLEAKRVRTPEGVKVDVPYVVWGINPGIGAGRFLNDISIGNKFQQAQKLVQKGVPTIKAALAVPDEPNTEAMNALRRELREFVMMEPALESVVYREAMRGLSVKLATPPTSRNAANWIARTNNHIGGDDILDPPGVGNFYVKRESIEREVRVHSFMGRSIRAGAKKLRDGWTLGQTEADYDPDRLVAHPWVRSFDAGWRISYDGVTTTQAERTLAHSAVSALGLNFGAVDIAIRPDGSQFVLEVNRAPGLEGGTIDVYANAITAWVGGVA
jgi:hypothetical protein